MENLRPNAKRAKTAVLFIWACLVAEALFSYSNYLDFQMYESFDRGSYSESDEDEGLIRWGIVSLVFILIYLGSVINFLKWFRRAYFNLRLKVPDLAYTEQTTLWAWIIPGVNLYLPHKLMKEIYKKTHKFLTDKDTSFKKPLSTSKIDWWWALWIVSFLLNQVLSTGLDRAITYDELSDSAFAYMFSFVFTIPLVIITVKVIEEYAQLEAYLAELPEEPPSSNFDQELE